MERKLSGSAGADHRGIDRHEINFDFVFLNIHKKIFKIVLWILHLWRYSKPKRTQSWQPDLLGPAQSNYLDLMISRGAFKHQELCDFLKNKALRNGLTVLQLCYILYC